MKKFVIQSVLLILVIGVALFFFSPMTSKPPDIPFLPQPAKFSHLQINGENIKVEIADTASKRSKGLGGRKSLGENEGMLFIFDKTEKHAFWMKGLSFALDFVWTRDDKVIDVLENIPPPEASQKDSDLPIYYSKDSVDKVLEVNAGTVKKLNIKAGDVIKLSPPN